jgi:hypothetical protein
MDTPERKKGFDERRRAQRQGGDFTNNFSILHLHVPKHLHRALYVYVTNIYTGLV